MLLEAHRMNTSNKRVLQVESEFSSLKYIRFHLTLGISLDLSSFMLPWKIMTSVSETTGRATPLEGRATLPIIRAESRELDRPCA